MRRRFAVAILVCVLAVASAQAGEIVDRIVAVVNNTPILLSDWESAWRCEAFLAGRAPDSYSKAEQREVFNRLVDQQLLEEQMRGDNLPPVTAQAVQQRVEEVRRQLAGGSESKWQEQLKRAGISQDELAAHLKEQIAIERFVEARLRAGIRVDQRSVRRYYQEEFLPKLRAAGGNDVPLRNVAGKIREILMQQQLTEQLNNWLQTLREQADIHVPPAIEAETPAK